MANKPAGNEWLKANFNLFDYSFTHSSYIGNNDSIELTTRGNIEQVYGPKYAPAAETSLDHLEFALKYDDLNLDFLSAVFNRLDQDQISNYVMAKPSGRYARKIGFLYEWLTEQQITLEKKVSGNYIDLLDPEQYVTGNTVKDSRWRVNNNLLGSPSFCPIIRRTKTLSALLAKDVQEKISQLQDEFPEDIFRRAISYLYSKETKSSYAIEQETPSPDRMERFITLLQQAGEKPTDSTLTKAVLVRLQNAIIDQRFAAADFRDFQNYVGQSLPNFQNHLHYICPPPQMVTSLMEGLKDAAKKTEGINPIVRAAMLAFGFVFIHPFEDGNGRLHRFLIHDILSHDGLVAKGMIIPVSAHMLNHMSDYDQILENYSRPLMKRIRYQMNTIAEVTVTHPAEIADYYRYPDLTAQAIYLAETIHATLAEDMPEELQFLLRYEEAKCEIQKVVDMPDKDINWMLVFLHQNKGVFPKRRRDHFPKLTDQEITDMQAAFQRVFEM